MVLFGPAVVELPDPSFLGAPSVILEYLDGLHMGEAGAAADFAAYVRTVAAIHPLDWRDLGLEFLGVPAGAQEAARTELEEVALRMGRFGCADEPLLLAALEHLRQTVPGDGRIGLCQGDINVFNYLFKDGVLVGVVDWEQARISDPRSDIAQLVALSHLKGLPFGPPRDVGFVRAYEEVTGTAVPGLEWFRAFWLFQLGVIYHGWVLFNDSLPWFREEDIESLLGDALGELA